MPNGTSPSLLRETVRKSENEVFMVGISAVAGRRSDSCFAPCGVVELYRGGRRATLLWRTAVRGGRCWFRWCARGYGLFPDNVRLSLRLQLDDCTCLHGLVREWRWRCGRFCLSARTFRSFAVAAAALLGATSFFVVSNYAVWAAFWHVSAHTGRAPGLLCGGDSFLPERFWPSTAVFLGVAFGVPALLRRFEHGSCAGGAGGEVVQDRSARRPLPPHLDKAG